MLRKPKGVHRDIQQEILPFQEARDDDLAQCRMVEGKL